MFLKKFLKTIIYIIIYLKHLLLEKINIELFSDFDSINYSTFDSEYIEYYSITNFELRKLLDKLKLNNKSEMFEKYYNNIESIFPSLNPTDINNTNKTNKINILISSTHSNNNTDNNKDDDNDYDSNKVKYYDISCVCDCIKMILSEELDNNLSLQENEFFNEIFSDFDPILIKDIDYLLKNGYIKKSIPKLSNFNILKKNGYKDHRKIIWSLFIEYGYLIAINTENKNNKKLIIRNKVIEELIKDKFIEWKNNLYDNNKEVINGINYFIENYDEERIKEFLENNINKVNYYYKQPSYLDNYYAIIYSLLCLKDGYKIITKSSFNEKDNIRELLFVDKKYQNDGDNSKFSSKIFYIIIKEKPDDVEFEESCYETLDYNEELIFNGKSLNKKNEKIIKYGITIYEKKCDVIYEINYGEKFQRKEMPKEIYSGEDYNDFNINDYYFVDKTRMIQNLINKKKMFI
ncbi:hypothetical protein BCR36DRAFT_450040 [Piromyces finnis]|uniref:AAA-ATPase-like domain-containing protein n=1 Tax=Piromyces finnis TaxID=1754191 RepID=A0A1Y1V949_9FUNG|nr:hypothetical protein BCR36DRAFT_450040 [Piromyces finnis]|eukprot:ORX49565.1 hypothetical protein BCR36DRAFT_450040 [Piromyces finnis]